MKIGGIVLALVLVTSICFAGTCPLMHCLKRSNVEGTYVVVSSKEECCGDRACIEIQKTKKSKMVEDVQYCIFVEQNDLAYTLYVRTHKYKPYQILRQMFCSMEECAHEHP